MLTKSVIRNSIALIVVFLILFCNTANADIFGSSGGTASDTTTDTSNFDNNLSAADDTVQKALDTIDDLSLGSASGSGAPLDATYIVQKSDDELTDEQPINALAINSILKHSSSGVIDVAIAGVDYVATETDPNALLTLGTDNVKDTHIDWGTGAGQVSASDMPNEDIGDITITGGAWAVEDDSHAHTSTSISGIDISADTNLTAGDHITLTDDDLDIDDDFLLNTTDSLSGILTINQSADNVGLKIFGSDDLAAVGLYEYIHSSGSAVVHSETGYNLSLYGGGSATDLELCTGDTCMVEVFSGTTGNPTFTIHGYDAGATTTKNGGFTVLNADGTFSISNSAGENIQVDAGGTTNILDTTLIQGDHTGLSSAQANTHLSLRGTTTTTEELSLGYDTTDNFGFIQARTFGSSYDTLKIQPLGGAIDAGGATSLEIPNGNPTIDTTGEIGIDDTASQLIYSGSNPSEVLVLSNIDYKTAVVENLAAADDNYEIWSTKDPVTIVYGAAHCRGTCTTPATFTFEDRAGNAMTGTVTAASGSNPDTFISIYGNNSLEAGDGLCFDVTNSVNPETDEYTLTFGVKKNRQ